LAPALGRATRWLPLGRSIASPRCGTDRSSTPAETARLGD
jgi:hypothetical protein